MRSVYQHSASVMGRLISPCQLVETVRKMCHGALMVYAGKLSREQTQRLLFAIDLTCFEKVIRFGCDTANLLSALGYRRLPQREDG